MSLPIDPDVAGSEARTRLHGDVVLWVFAGGCLGGWARYGITSAWPVSTGRFPWATFGVNVTGALVLGVVVVAATKCGSTRHLRPLFGTGFCGAFTTFSSIVVTADLLFAHGHPGTAVAYLAASIVGGLAAAWAGLVLGRAVFARRGPDTVRRPRGTT